jgi:hypothetical protein
MDLPIPEDPALAIKTMALKKEVMSSVLSAGVRVNDGALRKKSEDKVAAMLARVKAKTDKAPVVLPAEEDRYCGLFD